MKNNAQGKSPDQVSAPTENKTTALQVVKKETTAIETAAERIERNEKFSLVGEKFKFLQSKRKEVDHFLTAHDGTSSAKILVTNSKGSNLEISNPEVITDLLRRAANRLDQMIEETELEILSFKI